MLFLGSSYRYGPAFVRLLPTAFMETNVYLAAKAALWNKINPLELFHYLLFTHNRLRLESKVV